MIRLRKLQSTCWSHVFSPDKSGSLPCKHKTHKPWLHWMTSSFLIGGWPLALEWMVWLKKVLTPFLFWEPGPSGNIATTASLMVSLVMCLVLFRSSEKIYASGLLLGLEECHTSSAPRPRKSVYFFSRYNNTLLRSHFSSCSERY